jgi:hypothetical protein
MRPSFPIGAASQVVRLTLMGQRRDLTLPVWVQSNWVVYIIILIAAVGFFMPDGVRKNNKSKLGHYRRLPVLDEK